MSAVWFKPKNSGSTRLYVFDKKIQVWGSEHSGPNSSFESMRFLSQRLFYRLLA
jgi:hypothetical protein